MHRQPVQEAGHRVHRQPALTGPLAAPQLEKKQALPPFQPQITDDYGLDNFDTQFTSEPVQLTPDDE